MIKYIKEPRKISVEEELELSNYVSGIIQKVRKEGDAALIYYAEKFDKFVPKSFLVSREELAESEKKLPEDVKEELDFAMEKVGEFAEEQKKCLQDLNIELYPGMKIGHRFIPVESCGCYVPAGRYPCLTSAVMSVMPAKVAGVKRIVACAPPGKDGTISLGIQYTLYKMGVDEVYCVGGAQAIAAMAYGTETISPVDLIVGPGNKYVREAKRQVYGVCGIDFLAGPSEVQVIADETGSPDIIAADLLAQLEHDVNARASLVTTSENLGLKVMDEIEEQLKELKTEKVARESWEKNGEVVACSTLEECAEYANQYAPEHLEVHTSNPEALLPILKNYGSLFLGELTAEVYADKISGSNHILPTMRSARFTGGLWVGMFLKTLTHQMVTNMETSLMLAKYAETQATYEGMDAHRNAAAIRLKKYKKE